MSKVLLLKTEEDFKSFRKSKPVHSSSLTLRWVKNPNQNQPRFGFIVPKKIIAKVVDRNKLKRRLKHLVLTHQNSIVKADILFFPKKSGLTKQYYDLEKELIALLKHSKLWQL